MLKHIPRSLKLKEPLSRSKIVFIAIVLILLLLLFFQRTSSSMAKSSPLLLGEFRSCLCMLRNRSSFITHRCRVAWHHLSTALFAKYLSILVSHHWVAPSPPDTVIPFYSQVIGSTKMLNSMVFFWKMEKAASLLYSPLWML